MEFDELVRQRLRAFINERSWSVSRFASRYVQAYAEAYSKMEAPGTSTARKLIEDKTHRLTEREAQVLDSFTGLNLHELWLEEQKQLLLGKTEQYIAERNGKSHCNTAFDSQTLLENRIAALEKRQKAITLDDVISVIRRYVDIDTDKPLLVWSYSLLLHECIADSVADMGGNGTNLRSIKCDIVGTDRNDIAGLIEQATSHQGKMILGINSWDTILANEVSRQCSDRVIIFRIRRNAGIDSSLTELPYKSNLHPMYANVLRRCLDARPDFHELFRRQIESCIDSPWVKFPPFGAERECMAFLTKLHASQKQFIDTAEFKQLIEVGFPVYWLTQKCDQQSLLTAMRTYAEWCKSHPDFLPEKVKSVEEIDLDTLIFYGRVEHRSSEQWEEWFTNCYYERLVEIDLPQYYDIWLAHERRNRTHKK